MIKDSALMRPVVLAGQPIPSSNGKATASAAGTDSEFFNVLNHVNFANPISNLNAASDQNTGQITNPGDFGRITLPPLFTQ